VDGERGGSLLGFTTSGFTWLKDLQNTKTNPKQKTKGAKEFFSFEEGGPGKGGGGSEKKHLAPVSAPVE